jgi:hypothetical protein
MHSLAVSTVGLVGAGVTAFVFVFFTAYAWVVNRR